MKRIEGFVKSAFFFHEIFPFHSNLFLDDIKNDSDESLPVRLEKLKKKYPLGLVVSYCPDPYAPTHHWTPATVLEHLPDASLAIGSDLHPQAFVVKFGDVENQIQDLDQSYVRKFLEWSQREAFNAALARARLTPVSTSGRGKQLFLQRVPWLCQGLQSSSPPTTCQNCCQIPSCAISTPTTKKLTAPSMMLLRNIVNFSEETLWPSFPRFRSLLTTSTCASISTLLFLLSVKECRLSFSRERFLFMALFSPFSSLEITSSSCWRTPSALQRLRRQPQPFGNQ